MIKEWCQKSKKIRKHKHTSFKISVQKNRPEAPYPIALEGVIKNHPGILYTTRKNA
jgi:hypothetical protein